MFNELPIGAVVRLRNGKTATIIPAPDKSGRPSLDPRFVIYGTIQGDGEEDFDVWTAEGSFFLSESEHSCDIVDVVHYGTPAHVVSPSIKALAEALADKNDPTCAASGAGCDFTYTPRFDLYGCRYCGRDATPEEDKIMRTIDAPEPSTVMPPINRINRTDVDNFRTGNYVERDALNQYQEIATRSAIYPGQGTPFGVMYAALGLAEAGEIQNKVKKMFRDDGVIEFHGHVSATGREVTFKPITPERRLAIMKEMGGNLWYLAALAKEIGSTLSEIAFMNLDELCGRTERDTLNGDGDNR